MRRRDHYAQEEYYVALIVEISNRGNGSDSPERRARGRLCLLHCVSTVHTSLRANARREEYVRGESKH